ncbi:MAG TPA: AI-2E family transporter, partial [Paracoccus sp.]|nr:AI-2E family transporter [Paracoccus sp. (in: a-proteobacteria)]
MSPPSPLVTLTLSVLLAIMLGWLLMIGKGLLIPIIIAVMSVYVISTSSRAMARWPVTRHLPEFLRKMLLGLAFIAIIVALNWMVIVTARDLVELAPTYQANIEQMIAHGFGLFGLDENPDWASISDMIFGGINMAALFGVLA